MNLLRSIALLFCLLWALFAAETAPAADNLSVLQPATYAHDVEKFNGMEDENITNFVSNADSWNWLQREIPFFDCPDPEVTETYYFRWWSFRKHLVQTPRGFVFTEFLTPVRHAALYNTISCAAGFHVAEGRWLHDQTYIDDYINFWFQGEAQGLTNKFHSYSSWLPAATYDAYLVNHDPAFPVSLLDDIVSDYRLWQQERQLTNGLFWQHDVRDGMEESISGSRTTKNIRPTINSYMFANARAIADIAKLAGAKVIAHEYSEKADQLQRLTEASLWDDPAKFFEVRLENGKFSDAREEIGFIPWMFELPDHSKKYSAAWAQLSDEKGFKAPAGITTAERRNPLFRTHGVGKCEWDGAVWPFATSQTLDALANLLRDYRQDFVTSHDYFDAFLTYVHSQHADGKPYIGEYLDEVTGDWINGKGGRSRYYNHSTFADLVITGIVGLRPRADDVVEIDPLLPPNTWSWFCLDGVKYHGHFLTIIWDQTGTHYGHGTGLIVLADGHEIARGNKLSKLTGKLP
jgi:Trehalase